VSTRSFLIRGQRFPVGRAASLKVCVTPDGAISSVEVTRSSGEPGFDEFAAVWARQADVSAWVQKDQLVESCGSVRVEIGRGSRQTLDRGADNVLG
jgi:TonB family protein